MQILEQKYKPKDNNTIASNKVDCPIYHKGRTVSIVDCYICPYKRKITFNTVHCTGV